MLFRVFLLGLMASLCNSLPTNPIEFDGYRALRQIALTLDYIFDTHRPTALGRTHQAVDDPIIANFTAFSVHDCSGESTSFTVKQSQLKKCRSFGEVDPPSCMGNPPVCGFKSVSVTFYENIPGHQFNLFTSIDDHCAANGPPLGLGGCFSPENSDQVLESFEVLQTPPAGSPAKSECPQRLGQDRVIIVA